MREATAVRPRAVETTARVLVFVGIRGTLQQMHDDDIDDRELMRRYCRGDAAAFDRLYARYRKPVFTYLLRHSQRDRAEVEEVFQDCWFKLVRNRGKYDPARPFAPWLYTIARNCMLDRWRQLGRVESLHVNGDAALGASSDGLARPDRRAGSEQIGTRWQQALAALPAEQREAVLLQFESGMSLDEIAGVTRCGRETVKSRLRYAMRKLREALADLRNEAIDERA